MIKVNCCTPIQSRNKIIMVAIDVEGAKEETIRREDVVVAGTVRSNSNAKHIDKVVNSSNVMLLT